MYTSNNEIIFSPSDLTQYSDSVFASWMDHLRLTNPEMTPSPDEVDDLSLVLQKKGNEHEKAILSEIRHAGKSVAIIERGDQAAERTIEAMKNGIDVICQGFLSEDRFSGYSDFLVKVSGSSKFGDYHYEVWDSKLSKTLQPNYVIQLCCYADMLQKIQSCFAEYVVVVLGDGKKEYIKLNDYFYYYLQLKIRFLQLHDNFDPASMPDPMNSHSWGRWASFKDSFIVKVDHLAQVATITKSQIKKLKAIGIDSMQKLATMTDLNVKGMADDVLQRLINQANLQKQSAGCDVPLYQMLDRGHDEKKGLSLLPHTTPYDIYFDIEGTPLYENGLEYLWGATYFDNNGHRQYKEYWAHTHLEEKVSFQSFIQWAYQKWLDHPGMHIYHYGHYEIDVCRRLMGRYGVCEHEVDQLLRNEVFVDLYKIVKSSMLIGEPKYSIKNVEHLYRAKRETVVGTGMDSVVVYELWRENKDGDTWEVSKTLSNIRDYNIDDCNSTQELVVWLSAKQKELGLEYLGKNEITEAEFKEEVSQRINLRNHLLSKAEKLAQLGAQNESKLILNLAWLLEFHRRESKPVFWKLFDRLGRSNAEHFDDLDCLANCIRTEKPPFKPKPNSRNLAYEYKFDPDQEFKATAKKYYVLEHASEDKRTSLEVVHEASDLNAGIIVLQSKNDPGELINLIPDEYVRPDPIPEAIARQVEAFDTGNLDNCAIIDFLKRSDPRIKNHHPGAAIVSSNDPEIRMEQIIKAVSNLENSYLPIQGPPGAGKTYTARRIIAELVKKGKKIAISSNSHKAINHLLKSVARQCLSDGVTGYFACSKITDDDIVSMGIDVVENAKIGTKIKPGCVIGTTAWGFAREDLSDKFDYLFIDEAGQVSLANLVAMSQATRNIVLIGDQMQLGQPSQGVHPEDSGMSVLDYLLHGSPTIPDHMGVFLATTYRMHSSINRFISEAIYEGKLIAEHDNDKQSIAVPDEYNGVVNKSAGIIYVPVEHEGNTQASDEEVIQIVRIVKDLLGRVFTDKHGESRKINWNDILFVSPYNFQVNKLKQALGSDARVGSVDKFQGQEAPVVVLSMCVSDPGESPRGINFLFDRNRLNVAISRAQCLAVVVANPGLTDVSVNKIEQMEKLNVYCRLVNRE